MKAKEYLNQAYWINHHIESKVQQLEMLTSLATRVTSVMQQDIVQRTRNVHKTEDTIIKMMELESDINREISSLVELKREIFNVIQAVEEEEYRTLLEKRYLNHMTWEEIAVDMNYSLRTVYRIHGAALEKVIVPAC
ncbi:MAG: DUF1492 domain-containing protein [Anaerovoracaceae bacterium]|jgi:DNA-directed RNA polymerase specialized sigma subunit